MNKDKQKQLITEIMNEDQKDGLYKKQTAVEWLVEQLGGNGYISTYESIKRDELQSIIEKAKEMHKQEVLGFKDLVDNHQIDALENNTIYLTAEELYNEIYGGNK